MPTSYSTLLGLALPVTGELSGTWGDEVNNYITQYLDSAVAGTQTISGSQTAVTLSRTTNAALSQAGSGSTGSSQYQVINCTGNPASTLTVTVPSTSKVYLVLNNTSTSQSVVVKPSAAAGVTVSAARAALIAWNGTDFELVGTDDASRLNGVLAAANGGTGQSSYTVGDILFASGATTLSKLADVATGNALISGGVGVAPSYGKIGLTTHVSGTLPIANGGTNGTATPTAGTVAYGTGTAYAFNTAGTSGQPLLSGGSGAPTFGTLSVAAGGTGQTSYTDGQLLIGNTTGNTLAKSTLTAGSGVTITNGAGTITISATGSGGTVTSVGATAPVASSGGNTPTISLNSAYGDTLNPYGSKTANFFLAAPNGSAGTPTFRAIVAADIPTLNQNTTGTAANITASSNSTLTTLSSLSLPGSQVSGNISGNAGNVTGTVAVANGGTGATTAANARTNLGGTTVGSNLFTLTNPSAVTFPRFNADNTVSALDAATFRSAIGAGTGSGTVTSVATSGSVNGITLTGGTITSTGTITLGGTLSGVSLTTQVSGTLPVANGGTGATTLTANNVILGNGTSAVQVVAPGSNGNVLTSNGTTWTSAAPSGSGGATQVGSVCLNNTTNLLYYAANPAAQTAAPFFSSANFVSLNSGWTSYTAFLPPKYSTYYGGWFTLGLVGGTYPTNSWVFFSTNGLNWIPFVYGPNNSFAKEACNDGTAAIAVDETNGRIFIAAQNTGAATSGVYYSSAPATQNDNSWTYSGFDDSGSVYGESPAINSMEWVQFTSTTANGAIVFCSGVVNDGTARVYTIAAGGTTGTLRVTYTPSTGVNSGWMVWNKTFQRIAIFHGGSTGVRYSATNSFASWSNSTMPAAANSGPGSAAMSGSRLACVTSSSNVRYTSDFSTWSTETAPQTLNAIWHNGTSWVGIRENATGNTGGVYFTNNANPTTWTRAVGGFFKTGTNVALRSN